MTPIILAAVATLACRAPAPHPDCQCICAPTDTTPAGLIYVCRKKHWYCPSPAAPVKPAPPAKKSKPN